MPEGPELHLSSQFINAICKGRIFSGSVRKNPIHKCAEVGWDAAAYTISSASRGKELKVFLQALETNKEDDTKANVDPKNGEFPQKLHLLFNFGMSGKFQFTPVSEMPKHAHLSFFTRADDMALSFVDYRRFGKWKVGADWSSDRGPCVLFEYPQFRSRVLNSLRDSAFNKPVCEVLLNQKYFNGIGNYLRAEICYRAGVRPFDQARAVFSALPDAPEEVKVKVEDGVKNTGKTKVKAEETDILELCNIIPLEVVGLGSSLYLPEDDDSDVSKFSQWLQCYYKPAMKNVPDHNKRTMWYHGDPGPMVPKEGGSKKRHRVYDKKLAKGTKKMKKEHEEKQQQMDEATSSTAKTKKRSRPTKADTQQTSPAKPKRITRKSLQTLVEESGETSKKTTPPAKKATKKNSKVANAVKKKSLSGGKRKSGGEGERIGKSVEQDAKYWQKARATRARIKRATDSD